MSPENFAKVQRMQTIAKDVKYLEGEIDALDKGIETALLGPLLDEPGAEALLKSIDLLGDKRHSQYLLQDEGQRIVDELHDEEE